MHRFSRNAPLSLSMLAVMALALALAPGTASASPAGPVRTAAAQAAAPTAGTFTALTPSRVLDTRSGLGGAGPVGPHGTVALHVLGVSGVPSTNVAAVALTVTATRGAASGYLTVFPDGAARPVASNLSFATGQNVANLVIVPVGANGNVRVYNGAVGTVDVLADVAGYFTGGTPSVAGSLQPLTLKRLLDTKSGATLGGIRSGSTIAVPVTGLGGVPASGVASVVVNLTATDSAASGYLTAYPNGTARPGGSNLNYVGGRSVANLAVVPVGPDGRITVFNGGASSVRVLVDVLGYYRAGAPTATGAFRSVTQQRILDTRPERGGPGRLTGGATVPLRVTGSAGIPATGVSAVVINLAAVSPGSGGYLTAYPGNTARPTASNVNFGVQETVAGLVTVAVGADGYVRIFDGGGPTDLIVDVVGYYVSNAPQTCSSVASDPNGTSVTRWDPVVRCVLGMLGVAQSAANVSDVDTVIRYESSGNPNAVNNWDSNAQAGHPSSGLVQVIQPTFDYYRSQLLPTNLFDPAANIYAGMHYAIETYGSIHNIPGLVSLRNGGGYQGYIVTR